MFLVVVLLYNNWSKCINVFSLISAILQSNLMCRKEHCSQYFLLYFDSTTTKNIYILSLLTASSVDWRWRQILPLTIFTSSILWMFLRYMLTLIKAGPSDNIHRFLPENRRKILFVGYCRTCKVLGIFSKFNHTITKMIFEVFKLKFFFQSNYYKFSFKGCSS